MDLIKKEEINITELIKDSNNNFIINEDYKIVFVPMEKNLNIKVACA